MTLRERTRAAARALRAFLAGFTGMPAARLESPCPGCGGDARRAARDALAARASRRQSCC
jgi:hypothetical protein